MQQQCLIPCHHSVLPPPDIAALNAIAAREIHISGGSAPGWLYACSHPLQAGMRSQRETTVKRVCQGPHISFFPTAGQPHQQSGEGEHFVHLGVLESEREKTREVPGRKSPVPAEVREGQETSPRLYSTTSCHNNPHKEELPKEVRLAGG